MAINEEDDQQHNDAKTRAERIESTTATSSSHTSLYDRIENSLDLELTLSSDKNTPSGDFHPPSGSLSPRLVESGLQQFSSPSPSLTSPHVTLPLPTPPPAPAVTWTGGTLSPPRTRSKRARASGAAADSLENSMLSTENHGQAASATLMAVSSNTHSVNVCLSIPPVHPHPPSSSHISIRLHTPPVGSFAHFPASQLTPFSLNHSSISQSSLGDASSYGQSASVAELDLPSQLHPPIIPQTFMGSQASTGNQMGGFGYGASLTPVTEAVFNEPTTLRLGDGHPPAPDPDSDYTDLFRLGSFDPWHIAPLSSSAQSTRAALHATHPICAEWTSKIEGIRRELQHAQIDLLAFTMVRHQHKRRAWV